LDFSRPEEVAQYPEEIVLAPSRRIFAVGRPARVLLLVVEDDLVEGLVFVFVARHSKILAAQDGA
jgi:hypothetical protein